MASNEDLDEFVRLSLTDSYYAKVVFQDVKDFYYLDEDLHCTYAAVSESVPLDGDKIALYKVGWSSVLDYVVAVPCQDQGSDDGYGKNKELNVTFQASRLPKDIGEFYQFCYITKDGDIRGGSTPFLFKSSSPNDIVSVEDIENDVLLIQTRTTILEQSLQNTMKEKSKILIDKQLLANNLHGLESHVLKLETMLMHKNDIITELEEKLAFVEADTSKRMLELEGEISQNEHFISGLRAALTTFGKDKDEIDQHMKTVLEDREKLKEIVKSLEVKLDEALSKEHSMATQIKSLQSQIRELADTNRSLEISLEEKCAHIQRVEEAIELQQTQNNSLTTHLIDTESMLAAMATSKALAAQELQKHMEKQNEFEKWRQSMEEQRAELVSNLVTKDEQIHVLESKLNDKEGVSEKLMGENVQLLEDKAVVQAECEKLKADVKDYHSRILLGAEEYRQKYLEWHKVNRNYIKLQQKIQNRLSKLSAPSSASAPLELSVVVDMGDSSGCGDTDHSTAQQQQKKQIIISQKQADEFWSSSHNCSPQQSAYLEQNEAAANDEPTLPLNPQQKEHIFNEMVNQLHKFQSSSNSVSSGSSTDENVDVVAAPNERYPYPLHYPYPYPVGKPKNDGQVEDNREYCRLDSTYEFVDNPACHQLPVPPTNLPETYIRPSPWPPYCGAAAHNSRHPQVPDPFFGFQNDHSAYPRPDPAGFVSHQMPHSFVDQDPVHVAQPSAKECANMAAVPARAEIRCPICVQPLRPNEDINEHLDGHIYLKCPICALQFDREVDGFEKFNSHVVDHFD